MSVFSLIETLVKVGGVVSSGVVETGIIRCPTLLLAGVSVGVPAVCETVAEKVTLAAAPASGVTLIATSELRLPMSGAPAVNVRVQVTVRAAVLNPVQDHPLLVVAVSGALKLVGSVNITRAFPTIFLLALLYTVPVRTDVVPTTSQGEGGPSNRTCRSGAVVDPPYGICSHSSVAPYSPGVLPRVHCTHRPLSAAAARVPS